MRKIKVIALKSSIVAAVIGMAVAGAGPLYNKALVKADQVKEYLLDKITRVEVVREYVQPTELSTEEMIDRISLVMGVNPTITKAIARQESGKNYRADALKFEPHLESRFAKMASGTEERRMLATSIGVMQVIPGFHLKTCELSSYADLFDRRINITCGLTVLKKCLEYHEGVQSQAQRFRLAFKCYNGGDTYADSIFNHIGQIVLEEGLH